DRAGDAVAPPPADHQPAVPPLPPTLTAQLAVIGGDVCRELPGVVGHLDREGWPVIARLRHVSSMSVLGPMTRGQYWAPAGCGQWSPPGPRSSPTARDRCPVNLRLAPIGPRALGR